MIYVTIFVMAAAMSGAWAVPEGRRQQQLDAAKALLTSLFEWFGELGAGSRRQTTNHRLSRRREDWASEPRRQVSPQERAATSIAAGV